MGVLKDGGVFRVERDTNRQRFVPAKPALMGWLVGRRYGRKLLVICGSIDRRCRINGRCCIQKMLI